MKPFNVGDKVKCVNPRDALNTEEIYEVTACEEGVFYSKELVMSVKDSKNVIHINYYCDRFELFQTFVDVELQKNLDFIKVISENKRMLDIEL